MKNNWIWQRKRVLGYVTILRLNNVDTSQFLLTKKVIAPDLVLGFQTNPTGYKKKVFHLKNESIIESFHFLFIHLKWPGPAMGATENSNIFMNS